VITSTDPIGDSLGSLYTFATQDTADATQRVYNVLIELDSFAYDAAKHRRNMAVTGFEDTELDLLAAKLDEFKGLRVKLIQAFRTEMGLPPLIEPSATPTPATSTWGLAYSPIRRSGSSIPEE
jgi:hypothetical protein